MALNLLGSSPNEPNNGINWTAVLETLECPVCREYMLEPIRQCVRGHSICNHCYGMVTICPVCRSPRALLSSAMTQCLPEFVAIPCRYKEKGCKVSRLGIKIRHHEVFCKYNVRRCPQYLNPDCKWEGCFKDLLHHCVNSHRSNCLQKPQKVTFRGPSQFREAEENVLFGIAYIDHKLFRLSLVYSKRKDTVSWSCSYYGPSKNATHFGYEVSFLSSGQAVAVFSRQCSPFYEDDTGYQCKYSFKTPLKNLIEYSNGEGNLNFYLKITPLRIFTNSRLTSNSDTEIAVSPQVTTEMTNSSST